MTPRFVLGVDIGQAQDFTAIVVLERGGTELHVRHVERLSLGLSYPRQVERVADLVGSPELARDVQVAVDSTGVGRAVTELLQEALRALQTPLTAISITGGSKASKDGSRWSVPKRDLIAAAQVALQTRKLKIAAALPSAQLLTDELAAYRVRVSEDGKDSFGNGREAPHDDLVLALAIAVYAAKKPQRRTRITHVGLEPPVERGRTFVPDGVIPDYIFR